MSRATLKILLDEHVKGVYDHAQQIRDQRDQVIYHRGTEDEDDDHLEIVSYRSEILILICLPRLPCSKPQCPPPDLLPHSRNPLVSLKNCPVVSFFCFTFGVLVSGGYHICFTHRRSWVRSPKKPLCFFFFFLTSLKN